jgi:hypothetical protein
MRVHMRDLTARFRARRTRDLAWDEDVPEAGSNTDRAAEATVHESVERAEVGVPERDRFGYFG